MILVDLLLFFLHLDTLGYFLYTFNSFFYKDGEYFKERDGNVYFYSYIILLLEQVI